MHNNMMMGAIRMQHRALTRVWGSSRRQLGLHTSARNKGLWRNSVVASTSWQNAGETQTKTQQSSEWNPWLASSVAVGAGLGIAVTTSAVLTDTEATGSPVLLESSPHVLSRNFIADAVEKASPAVVNILVAEGRYGANGSGFIISSSGLVVTNAHVVEHANRYSRIQVTLADGRTCDATVHSLDSLSDIAIIQLVPDQPTEWPTIKIGSSESLRAGEWVVALGSPFTLQNSVSAGIVSAVARHSSELGYGRSGNEYIQTDAAINVGNSGGPLVNLDGEVIGINSMKIDRSVGISFAIPIDIAMQVIDQLLKNRRVMRPFVGLQLVSFNSREMLSTRLAHLYPDIKEGVVVKSVRANSPAHKAGILPQDVIVEFDGKEVHAAKDVIRSVGYDIGRKIKVVVRRMGLEKPIELTLITEALPERKLF